MRSWFDGFGQRSLSGAIVGASVLDFQSRRLRGSLTEAVGQTLSRALTTSEQERVTIDLWQAIHALGMTRTVPFSWEGTWFERRLPPPPARLFLGAAGEGRILRVLLSRGYAIDAAEPTGRGARACAEILGDPARVSQRSHAEWARSVLRSSGDEPLYDAVLLGWGSLSFVLDPVIRRDVIRASHRVCPDGPILMSFLYADGGQRVCGRAERLGASLGNVLRQFRQLDERDAEEARVNFRPWQGFTHPLSQNEVEALACDVGRRVLWETESDYAHVTLVRDGSGLDAESPGQ